MIKTHKYLKDNWFVFNNIDTLSKYVARDIVRVADSSIKKRGKFIIVLAGGGSFSKVYKVLSNLKSDWEKWHVFIGDERCLMPEDFNRNDYLINKVWLKNSLIPKRNIQFMHPELGVESCALQYEKLIDSIDRFDLVLLGMGEDGHTASLFPGHTHSLNKKVIVETNAPKLPTDRVSLSYNALNNSLNVFKVIRGPDKGRAVDLWINGLDLPIGRVHGDVEKVYLCKDVLPASSL